MSRTVLTILATLAAARFAREFAIGWVRTKPEHHAGLIRDWTYKTDRETAEYRTRNQGKDPDIGGYDAAETTEEKS